jgi:MFS family permease
MLALGLSGLGLAVVGVVPANALPLALGAMLFGWFMNAIAHGALFATLQAIVPADMQGRVFTLLQSGAGLMAPLGLAIAGPLASVLGVQFWFIAAGLIITIVGSGGLLIPAVLHIEDQTPDRIATSNLETKVGVDEKIAAPMTASQ